MVEFHQGQSAKNKSTMSSLVYTIDIHELKKCQPLDSLIRCQYLGLRGFDCLKLVHSLLSSNMLVLKDPSQPVEWQHPHVFYCCGV